VSSITLNANTRLEFFNATAAVSPVTSPIIVNGTGVRIGNGSTTGSIVGSPITLNGDLTIVPLVNNTSSLNTNDPLTLTGVISDGSAAHAVTVQGQSTLTLSGANTFSGG